MCRADDFPPYDGPSPVPTDELDPTRDRAHFRLAPPAELPGMVGHECLARHPAAPAWCIRVADHDGRHVYARAGS